MLLRSYVIKTPHAMNVAGIYLDPDLNSVIGGITQREQVFDHEVLSRKHREQAPKRFWTDDIGLVQGDHEWMITHSYTFSQPSDEIGRWVEIARK